LICKWEDAFLFLNSERNKETENHRIKTWIRTRQTYWARTRRGPTCRSRSPRRRYQRNNGRVDSLHLKEVAKGVALLWRSGHSEYRRNRTILYCFIWGMRVPYFSETLQQIAPSKQQRITLAPSTTNISWTCFTFMPRTRPMFGCEI
jgi:hypothetical protein